MEKLLIDAAPLLATLLPMLPIAPDEPSTGVFMESDLVIDLAGEIERMIAFFESELSTTPFKIGLKLWPADDVGLKRLGRRLSSVVSCTTKSWSFFDMDGEQLEKSWRRRL